MTRQLKFIFFISVLCLCQLTLPAQQAASYQDLLQRAAQDYQSGNFEDGAQAFEQASAVQTDKDKSDNLYNAACCWSLAENKEKAFADLDQVATFGMQDVEHVLNDPDLQNLHSDPQWNAMTVKFATQFTKGRASFLWGIYFGILFILFFYNLFLFFSLKEISFLYFAFFLFMYASLEMVRTFYFALYLNDVLFWMKHLRPANGDSFDVCVFSVTYLPFVWSLLDLKRNARIPGKWMKGLFLFFVAATLLTYFSGFPGVAFTYPVFMGTYLFTVACGIYLWKRKFRAARFFVIGNFFLFLGLLWNVLYYSGLIQFKGNILVFHPDNVTIVVFLFMSSFALGDKINLLKSEKVQAQEKALEVLEEKVTERTAEVVKQKEIIEEKNKDILASIQYAKRIQTSLLPTDKYVEKTIKRLNND
ncbi:MAG TPA: 7TM diverse intracellular signaling domain-containing protein [Bacteroidia bacterium]|nr:7TM diverse intracellular signaling domain-containing protein [Bacteroidia bacterium]